MIGPIYQEIQTALISLAQSVFGGCGKGGYAKEGAGKREDPSKFGSNGSNDAWSKRAFLRIESICVVFRLSPLHLFSTSLLSTLAPRPSIFEPHKPLYFIPFLVSIDWERSALFDRGFSVAFQFLLRLRCELSLLRIIRPRRRLHLRDTLRLFCLDFNTRWDRPPVDSCH